MNNMRRFQLFLITVAALLLTTSVDAQKNEGKLGKRLGPPLATDRAEDLAPVDWLFVYAKSDGPNLRIGYQCRTPVDFAVAAAYSIFIDVDGKRTTGFVGGANDFPIGADYLLQGSTLYRYDYHGTGSYGTDWQWSEVKMVRHELDGTEAEFWVPLALMENLGKKVGLFFYGDNTAKGVDGESEIDLAPDQALKVGGGGKFFDVTIKP